MQREPPSSILTPRMRLRPWAASDAPALLPVLERNWAHLAPWIPAHVATPVPLAELAERLSTFADDFAAGRAFRYALFGLDDGRLIGEADLFPRDAAGRVPLAKADRVELGYWLDCKVTGRGLATEAAGALVELANTLGGVTCAEIRCETANKPSRRVPMRLGFALTDTLPDVSLRSDARPVLLEVWTLIAATPDSE
jgi:RimJ/RimL family protein N-acetyltransferase